MKKLYSNRLRGDCVGRNEVAPHDRKCGLVLYLTQGETLQNKLEIARNKKLNDQTNISKIFDEKIITYGSYIDHHIYKTTRYTFTSSARTSYQQNPTKRRIDNVHRTRNNLYYILTANIENYPNYKPTFVTLTHAKNHTCLKTSNQLYKNFIKRLNYTLKTKIKYVTIIEFQKRGSIHYHSVFFNLPYINFQQFEKTWSHGFTNIRVVDNINNTAKYLTKYLKKGFFDNRLSGQKAFLSSRGLIRPQTFHSKDSIDTILTQDILIKYAQYENTSVKITKYKK